MAATIAVVGAIVGRVRAPGHRVAVAHRGRVGRPRGAARTVAPRRVRVGDLGVTLHDVPAARALASFGGVAARHVRDRGASTASCSTSAVAVRARPAAGARAGRGGLVGLLLCHRDRRRHPLRADRSPGTSGSRCSRATTRSCASPSRTASCSRAEHLALADRLQGHYDLIVFPESSLDTDPETDPDLRAQLTAIAAKHDSSVLVNARRSAPTGRPGPQLEPPVHPDGRLQGIYSKQHLVPFGEYVPWRDELSFLQRAAPDPVRLPGRRPRRSVRACAGTGRLA